jgi:hypothetical protein
MPCSNSNQDLQVRSGTSSSTYTFLCAYSQSKASTCPGGKYKEYRTTTNQAIIKNGSVVSSGPNLLYYKCQ